ncbi:MAG: type I restriction enzyme HsdR N-terminal domain-containing protein [Prevotellaceae bacterium]|jgi:predicted type IV restriction endonuclease|nr:type I restriction enzyme HsdR N-terminal domain-containing protein [Prevotellaceae bacterium]
MNEKEQRIFDPIRRQYVKATPEEVVRQHIINYLTNHKGAPQGLITVERSLKLNGLTKRCDILVCDRNGNPLLLVECKAPEVKITNSAFEQIARYNLTLRVPYLVVTNGSTTYCCKVDFDTEKIEFLKDIPGYEELSASAVG